MPQRREGGRPLQPLQLEDPPPGDQLVGLLAEGREGLTDRIVGAIGHRRQAGDVVELREARPPLGAADRGQQRLDQPRPHGGRDVPTEDEGLVGHARGAGEDDHLLQHRGVLREQAHPAIAGTIVRPGGAVLVREAGVGRTPQHPAHDLLVLADGHGLGWRDPLGLQQHRRQDVARDGGDVDVGDPLALELLQRGQAAVRPDDDDRPVAIPALAPAHGQRGLGPILIMGEEVAQIVHQGEVRALLPEGDDQVDVALRHLEREGQPARLGEVVEQPLRRDQGRGPVLGGDDLHLDGVSRLPQLGGARGGQQQQQPRQQPPPGATTAPRPPAQDRHDTLK